MVYIGDRMLCFGTKANWRFTKDLQGKVNGIFYKEETFETTEKKIK